MKISIKILSGCVISVIALCGVLLLNVSAQDASITDQQVQQIRDNCLSAKNTLNQLHVSDALLRVNMGQVYESVGTKLMDGFNNRVSSNKYSDVDLISATKNYRLMLDAFRADYQTYEEQLSTTIKIDCSKEPVSFYDAVLWARIKRNQVGTDVKNLNQYIEQYQLAVSQFEKDFQAKSSGDKK